MSSDQKIAEGFNSFFSSVISDLNLHQNNDILVDTKEIEDPILKAIIKFSKHPSILKINNLKKECFSFEIVSIEAIESEILNLNISKSCQDSDIPTKIIKENADMFGNILFHNFNGCLIDSIFPDIFKLADIVPIFKKGDRTLKENYRPISILSNLSKIYEKFLYNQISCFFENILSKYQCGFRKGISVQHCLLLMTERWKKSVDAGNAFGAMLTDLSKAFDCVVHDLLIAKLHAYGFDKSSLKLIHSYLTNRKQRVKINSSYSSWSRVLSGVPQGSILGPLFFNIYICDMFLHLDGIDIAAYADDNTPYINGACCEAVTNNLVKSVSIMNDWFNANYMKLNSDKCHLILSNKSDCTCVAKIGNDEILPSTNEKLLGVYIDNKLTFETHIKKMCSKARIKLNALSRISHYLDFHKKKLLMKAFIQSQFNYCPLLWMLHSRKQEHSINKIHERALRITYSDNNSSFEDLLEKDKSVTIHQKNLQYLATEMYKVKNKISPQIMEDVFEIRELPSYNLRNPSEFIRRAKNSVKYGEKSLSFLAPIIWDLIPCSLKNLDSLDSFKRAIKSWTTDDCPCHLCRVYLDQVGYI